MILETKRTRKSASNVVGKSRLLQDLVESTAKNPAAWLLYRTCGRVFHRLGLAYTRAQAVRESTALNERFAPELSPELTVMNGPFRQLRYPSLRAVGSAFLPKLLGSYESELHPILEEMLRNDYQTIVDIGCAEGYYAVGCAMRLPHAEVFAFDTNETAKQLCANMAVLNGVGKRVHVGNFCDAEVLMSIPFGNRALIVSDCEGYEGALFNTQIAEFMVSHDVIIETHDFIEVELSTRMRQIFEKTHNIKSIKSVDDVEKVRNYSYPQLVRYSTQDKYRILAERRPAIMEWLIMTSKEPRTF